MDYGFADCLLRDQCWNFESKLIKELCNLAKVKKVRTTPYNLETNGQHEKFNSTLINMIGKLEQRDKSHWKDLLSLQVHMHNCTKNNSTEFSLIILCLVESLGFQ